MKLQPVLLAGGSGTRLWPISTPDRPKQFIALSDSRSMLGATIARLDGLGAEAAMVLANQRHRDLVLKELDLVGTANCTVMLEPESKNTGPAIALAAMQLPPEALMLVMPADHVIDDVAAFQAAVRQAQPDAQAGVIVLFGVPPTSAHTGYGYIRCGPPDKLAGCKVLAFHEKPDKQIATAYLLQGGYYWNSGIFLFKAQTLLEELQTYAGKVHDCCHLAQTGISSQKAGSHQLLRLPADCLTDCPAISIDKAVMEKTDKAVMHTLQTGWLDIGSWAGLAEYQRTKTAD